MAKKPSKKHVKEKKVRHTNTGSKNMSGNTPGHTKKKAAKQDRRNKNIDNKLNRIIAIEDKLLSEEKTIEKKENAIKNEEGKIEGEEKDIDRIDDVIKKEESDIEKLEKIEQEIKAEVGEHPLANVTFKDLAKGMIGAFIGLVIHYTFVYGVEIADNLTMVRATIMFPLTFIVGLLFIYATGFRKVQDKRLLLYMPLRMFVLYMCALIMSILVLYLFYPSFGQVFEESYKRIAGVMLAAVVGACTADLLGKE